MRPISEVAEFYNSKRIPLSARQRDDRKGPYPYYGASGIVDYIDDYIFDGTYLLISEDGENLRARKSPIAFKASGKFWVNNHAHVLAEREPGMLDYLEYAFSTLDISPYVTGAVQPKLNKRSLESIKLPIPDINERLAINSVLSSLTDKIELNRRTNETLEAMAQAIFRDWFVDFGPVRRKLEGASDPVNIMGGLVQDKDEAARLATLFPAAMADNGLPERWEPRTVGDDFDVTMGQSPPGETYNETGDGLPFFQGRRDFGFRFPTLRVYCTEPARVAEADWTLVSVRAPVGDINRARTKCCIGRGVGAIRHKRDLLSFTYYTALSLKEELARYDKDGTVFGSINQKQLKSLPTIAGNTQLAEKFDSMIAPVDSMIRLKEEESQTLSAMRNLLLPILMSGEIRLAGAEGLMSEAC